MISPWPYNDSGKVKTIALILALIAALNFCLPVRAQSGEPPTPQPLVLTAEQGKYPLGLHMDILEDPGGRLTIDDVSSSEFASQFTPSQVAVPNYGYSTDSAFWIRLLFENQSPLTSLWLLEVNFPNLNYVDLYLPSESGGYRVKQSGALRPFDTRDIPYYHVVFKVPLAFQAEQTFYIRVKSGSSMTLAFTLWAPESFAVKKINDMWGTALFYGALMIALGYHLFLFFSLREANYFYFILFIASSILYWAVYEGVGDLFFWPGLSQYKFPFLVIAQASFYISCLKFSDVFLEQKTKAPRFHLLINLLIGLWLMLIVLVPFVSYGTMSQIAPVCRYLTTGILLSAGIYSWSKGNQLAKFYLISWLGFFIGLVIADLVRAGVVPSTPLTEKSYHIGEIWLVLLWALALASRINQLKTETEDANRRLVQSEHKLSQTLEGLPLGVVVYGPQRTPTYVNQRAVDILSNPEKGITADISAGRTLTEAMKYYAFRLVGSEQSYPLDKIPVAQAFEGQNARVDDAEADLVDRRVPLEIWANPVRDEHGKVESVVAAFQDITERRQAQARLEEYRLQLESMVKQRTAELSATNEQLSRENAERQRLEAILRLRLEWLVEVNQVYQTIGHTGELPDAYRKFTLLIKHMFDANDAFLAEMDARGKQIKLLSHTCQDALHPDLTGLELQLDFSRLANWRFEQGIPIIFTLDQLKERDAPTSVHYQHTQSQYFVLVPQRFGDNTIGLLGLEFLETERLFSANEIALTEQICLDISQVRDKAQMADQTEAFIAADERNRLARDLHDSVTQVLFSASLVAEVLPQIWRRNPEQAWISLEELRRLTRGALAEMRAMLLELRPAGLISTPLSDLLTQLAEAVAGRAGLTLQLFIEQIPPLPEEVHVSFYRIAQESFNNISKHAQANQVTVSLNATSAITEQTHPWRGQVTLVIHDDGRGFVTQNKNAQHFGLAIMQERAAAIQATLSVESQPGQGTRVTLNWQC